MTKQLNESERLLQMKEKIEEAKTAKAQAEGERKAVFQSLSDAFGVTTLKQAERKLMQLDKEIEEKEAAFATDMEKVEAEFPWEVE